MKTTIKLNRAESDYAWAECKCGNTVKFSENGSIGVCPNCSRIWKCQEGIAYNYDNETYNDEEQEA